MNAPILTDRSALLMHRARARASDEAAWFLHDAARSDVEERLQEVNRRFSAPAVVTGHPARWAGVLSPATVIGDAPVLELHEGAHDLIVHALALHWADDPVGQLIQCRRALRPDGLFLGITFGGQTLHELRTVLAETESRLRGGLSPRIAPMGEIRDLGGLLHRAGFALPVADSQTITVTYRGLGDLVRDLRAIGETNALATRDRRPLTRRELDHAAKFYADAFPAGDGRITATFELVYLTGWAPSNTQPRPLRPGSAAQRLADALGTEEHPAGDSTTSRRD